jgi:hypothetical protein
VESDWSLPYETMRVPINCTLAAEKRVAQPAELSLFRENPKR